MNIYCYDTPKAGRAWYWRGFFCVFALALLLCLAAGPAQADEYWWVGSVSQSMNDADNWADSIGASPAGPPQNGDTIHFDNASAAVAIYNLPGSPSLQVVVTDTPASVDIQSGGGGPMN
ncbi:MAG: hypothetical protein PVG60_09115, partial [Desulfarculaceae bacterium]